jgi:hypothetical protein
MGLCDHLSVEYDVFQAPHRTEFTVPWGDEISSPKIQAELSFAFHIQDKTKKILRLIKCPTLKIHTST